MVMLVHKIIFQLFRTLARWRRPGLAACLLLFTTRHWPVTQAKGKWRYRALVLSRTGFQEDVEQSFRGADDFEVIAWPSFALKAFASELLAPLLDHNNYI